ncbi:MAG: tetratricopeptide repeat protein [Acidobacteriaceae bacterium]|nr:tetratricopeptide repeat protein [Acidobacteriaceae bacterium]
MLVCACLLLLASDPAQANSLLKQGLLALQRGDLVEARADLEHASRADPANAYVWSSLAETYARLHNGDNAMSAAARAEKLGAGNKVVAHALAIFYFQYADSLLRQENFTQAADVLTTALARHPDEPQLTLALGVARYGQRRFDDAIALFLKTVKLAPEAEQPYVFLGKMLEQAGPHLAEIAADFESYAGANPASAEAQLLLAKALLAADPHSDRALDLIRKSVSLDGNNWEAHFQLGVLLESKHDYADAAIELAASAQLEPKQPMPHYHLARVYDRLGEPERAKTEREIHQRLTRAADERR